MSFLKYFQERGGPGTPHNGPLQWPRSGDFQHPLRNVQQIALSQAEAEAIEPVLDFHCEVFNLWDEEARARYIEIQDRARNGWYTITFIERKYLAEHNTWTVLVEWVQIYGEIPNGKVPAELRGPVAETAVTFQDGRG